MPRDPQNEAKSLLDSAEQQIFEIRQGRESRGLQRIDEIIIDTYDRLQNAFQHRPGTVSGYSHRFYPAGSDHNGVNKTDLIFIAALPRYGQDGICAEYCHPCGKLGKKVAIFNLEMSKDQLVGRILSGEARIPGNALRTGNLVRRRLEPVGRGGGIFIPGADLH